MKFMHTFALLLMLNLPAFAGVVPGGPGSPASFPDGVTGGLTVDTLTSTGAVDLSAGTTTVSVDTNGTCGSGNICSAESTDSPTIGALNNLDGFTWVSATYMRIGNVVSVMASVNVDCAGAGFASTTVDLNTGIPSAFRTTALSGSRAYGQGEKRESNGVAKGILVQQITSSSLLSLSLDCPSNSGNQVSTLHLQYPI